MIKYSLGQYSLFLNGKLSSYLKGSFNVLHTKFTVPLNSHYKKHKGKDLSRWALYWYQILCGVLFSKCINFFPLDFLKGIKDQINVEPFRNSCELTAGDSVVYSDYMLWGFF